MKENALSARHLVRVRQHGIVGEAVRGGSVAIVPGEYYVDTTTFQFRVERGQEPALLFHGANMRDGGGDLMVRIADYPLLLASYPSINDSAIEVLSQVT